MLNTAHAASRPRRRRGVLATLLAAALAVGLMPLATTTAVAAPGDYAVDIEAPASVPVRQGFAYDVTLTVDATPDAPAEGIVLTAQLPEGVAFESVPTGGSSPVASVSYDPATRVVTFTMQPLVEQLVAFSFAVAQDANERKDERTTLPVSITGSTTPSGATPSDSAVTAITGDNAYAPRKDVETVVGSGNRTATYYFNIDTVAPNGPTFTTWEQRLTDTFPAGVVVTSTSNGWTLTSNADGSTTAVWDRSASYGPDAMPIDPSGRAIWIQVDYPEETFPDGTLPPSNTVGLETRDASGAWHDGGTATVQGPELDARSGESLNIVKGSSVGLDDATWANAAFTRRYVTAASYLSPDGTRLQSMTVTDAAAGNEGFFAHADVGSLAIQFNPAMAADALPYTLEYTTNVRTGWQTHQPTVPNTSSDAAIVVQTAGSVGFTNAVYDQSIDLQDGERLTGWRIVVSPDAGTSVPGGSEVRVATDVTPSFASLDDGSPATTPNVNTASVAGTSTAGTVLSSTDAMRATIVDQIPISTSITAPISMAVGEPATYEAVIQNRDPAGRSYADGVLDVVLPVGVLYDGSVGVSATSQATRYGTPVPQVGDGVTVTTSTVTDADGVHQVVRLTFDELVSTQAAGTQRDRWEHGSTAFRYRIPVTVEPQAFAGGGQAVTATSWAHTNDPAFARTPMGWYGPYYAQDAYDLDPARAVIARSEDRSTVTAAGGLLLGKLVRADESALFTPDAEVASPGSAQWQVYVQNVLPQAVTDVVLFDRLPVVGDGRDSDFAVTLSGPVTGAPQGATVEYSTDATTATTGTWTTDPVGATAFRVTVPSLATGDAVTLLIPTTVPAGLQQADAATNDVTATGTYAGAQRSFSSTQATIAPAALPSLSIVKTTNGVDYAAAPGAIVATGSEVTWSYTVTNTGNTILDDVAVADAFTAGDGSTGAFSATSSESGPLAPGASRTFTATGVAIAGQYENTATATAVAVDAEGARLQAQPAPATDSSWYLAGDAGLTIAKTTNGEDVASAPGLPLVPGSDVEWAYTVTNTGSLDLVDVLVVDVDANGVEVFRDTIASLPAGESVTLSASGTAIEGQYRNTVTASADDPSGASAGLQAADDSWYFGVVSSIAIDKTVGAAETGPFGESTTVASGAAAWWRFVVTNTGNAPLTDVTITDTPLGAPIEVGDLAPGESSTIVVRQGHVASAYTNVATVDGTDPTGGTVTDDDDAAVALSSSPSPSPFPGLPRTGAEIALLLALVAATALAVGVVVVARSRRRSAER